jgi:hypothetical protein
LCTNFPKQREGKELAQFIVAVNILITELGFEEEEKRKAFSCQNIYELYKQIAK